MKKNNAGFTLIELLIVVAIIGILASIIMIHANEYKIRGFNSAAVSDLRNFKTVIESVYIDQRAYPAL